MTYSTLPMTTSYGSAPSRLSKYPRTTVQHLYAQRVPAGVVTVLGPRYSDRFIICEYMYCCSAVLLSITVGTACNNQYQCRHAASVLCMSSRFTSDTSLTPSSTGCCRVVSKRWSRHLFSAHFPSDAPMGSIIIITFRAAAPFWGQTTQNFGWFVPKSGLF